MRCDPVAGWSAGPAAGMYAHGHACMHTYTHAHMSMHREIEYAHTHTSSKHACWFCFQATFTCIVRKPVWWTCSNHRQCEPLPLVFILRRLHVSGRLSSSSAPLAHVIACCLPVSAAYPSLSSTLCTFVREFGEFALI